MSGFRLSVRDVPDTPDRGRPESAFAPGDVVEETGSGFLYLVVDVDGRRGVVALQSDPYKVAVCTNALYRPVDSAELQIRRRSR